MNLFQIPCTKCGNQTWRSRRRGNVKCWDCISLAAKEKYKEVRLEKIKYAKIYRIANGDKIKARNRNRKNLMRSLSKNTDITNNYLIQLLNKSKNCPLCSKLMLEKHIDHIIPIGVGGKHRKNNIRIVCKSCNLSRPKDGSDLKK